MKNTYIRIKKRDSNSVFHNVSYEYKNIFNINKLPKKIYALITKKKYYNKTRTFHYKRIYKHLYEKEYINIYIVKKAKK